MAADHVKHESDECLHLRGTMMPRRIRRKKRKNLIGPVGEKIDQDAVLDQVPRPELQNLGDAGACHAGIEQGWIDFPDRNAAARKISIGIDEAVALLVSRAPND